MSESSSSPDHPPQGARALLGGIVIESPRKCEICGNPLRGRQKCCSGKCRAIKSRRKRIPIKVEELRELRAALVAKVAKLDEYLGG
jgi:predicted nucleic acid-binding Zn ribbon protein